MKLKKPKRADVKRLLKRLKKHGIVQGGGLVPGSKLCFVEDCGKRGEEMHECITCERLAAAGGAPRQYRVFACHDHGASALGEVKAHALIKHPINIGRVMLAGLKGEEI